MVPPLTLCAYMKKGPNLRWSLIQCSGGDEGDRTPDLLTASQALSQLSYAPVRRSTIRELGRRCKDNFGKYSAARGTGTRPKRHAMPGISRGARPAGNSGHRVSLRPRARSARRRIFSKIVLASSSEFPYSTSSHGGVAQLGERLTGSQEVRGSIPLVSTRALNEAPTQVGAFFHIGTQGQRRHHDPPGRQDRALNGCRVHGSISRRGATLLYMEVLHYLCNH